MVIQKANGVWNSMVKIESSFIRTELSSIIVWVCSVHYSFIYQLKLCLKKTKTIDHMRAKELRNGKKAKRLRKRIKKWNNGCELSLNVLGGKCCARFQKPENVEGSSFSSINKTNVFAFLCGVVLAHHHHFVLIRLSKNSPFLVIMQKKQIRKINWQCFILAQIKSMRGS